MIYKTEQAYKLAVMLALEGAGYRCQAHEDKHSKYIPDVSFSGNYVDGWIEIKYCPDKPPKSLGDLEHWTKGQEQWLLDHHKVGSGHCYLLVGVRDANYLWRADDLAWARGCSFSAAVPRARIKNAAGPGFVLEWTRLVRVRG